MHARSQRGQSLVELTIILPILLLLTVGVVDLTRVFSSRVTLSNGVREAALYASEAANHSDTAEIEARLTNEGLLDAARLTIDAPTCDGGAVCDDASETVTIRATYQMDLIVPMIQDILGQPVTMTAEATAPIIDHSE